MSDGDQKIRRMRIPLICALICIICVSFAQVIFCIAYPVPERDSLKYKETINEIYEKGQITDRNIPSFPLLLMSIPNRLFGMDLIKGGIVLNCMFGLLTSIGVLNTAYALTKSKSISTLAGIIVGTHPTMLRYSSQMLREAPFIFFTCFGIILALDFVMMEKKKHLLILSAIFVGLSFLSRHEGLEVFLLLTVFFFLRSRKKLLNISTYAVSFIITIVAVLYICEIDTVGDYISNMFEEILRKTIL